MTTDYQKTNVRPRILAVVASCLLIACGTPPTNDPFVPLLDVKQTMLWVLDPSADVIWDSAGSIITMEGTEDLAPTTDEGWDTVVHAAATLAESGNLLMMAPRAQSQGDWFEYSQGLISAAELALNAAQTHDADALFDAGGTIYQVCLSCHQVYARDESGPVSE